MPEYSFVVESISLKISNTFFVDFGCFYGEKGWKNLIITKSLSIQSSIKKTDDIWIE